MSEKFAFEDIPEILEELNDDWRHGPWDREVDEIRGIYYHEFTKWHSWKVVVVVNGKPCEPHVKIKDDDLILWGGDSNDAGQVERWVRRVALLTVVSSASRFRESLRKA